MHKIRELLGLPVLDLSTGKQIGEVKDVAVDIVHCLMAGIVLCHSGWFHHGKGILMTHIRSIGEDAITIENASVIMEEHEFGSLTQTYLTEETIGKHIVTSGGKTVGTLSDIVFDTETGTLTGYEVSDSVLQDLLVGRSIMAFPSIQNIGEDTIIIPDVEIWIQPPVKKS
jgi:uncharacterized protein YrrD